MGKDYELERFTDMNKAHKYDRDSSAQVVAVKLDLDTPGFTYNKWGGKQKCKKGDWIVRNGNETYTIDSQSFSKTYKKISLGVYVKKASVWAHRSSSPGKIKTKEGYTSYKKGDWIVSNNKSFTDQYALSDGKFNKLYNIDSKSLTSITVK